MFYSVAVFLILCNINLSNALSEAFSSAQASAESYSSVNDNSNQCRALKTGPVKPSTPFDSESKKNLKNDFNKGNLQFTANFLFNIVKDNPNKSVTVSPYSVLFLLAELALYATGKTYQQLMSALNLKNKNQIKTVIPIVLDSIFEQKNVSLNLAERVYSNIQNKFSNSFKRDTKNIFRAESKSIDFSSPQTAADVINRWVAEQTNNKIQGLIPASVLTPDTKLVLVNALYFLGKWRNTFRSDNTSPQNFYVSENKTVKVDMMNQVKYFAYTKSNNLNAQVIELPYVNGNLTFLILLPIDKNGAEGLVTKLLHPNELTNVRNSLKSNRVDLSLPKFKTTTTTDLKETLKKLNITGLFDPNARGLSGIFAKPQNIVVSAGIQKADIEVNESGSEAAAGNAIIGVATAAFIPEPPIIFNADHPFIYYLLLEGFPIFCGLYAGN